MCFKLRRTEVEKKKLNPEHQMNKKKQKPISSEIKKHLQREGYLVIAAQSVVSQQRPALDRVRSVVNENGSVFYLQDLDAVSHQGRHTELTQLQRK